MEVLLSSLLCKSNMKILLRSWCKLITTEKCHLLICSLDFLQLTEKKLQVTFKILKMPVKYAAVF